MLPSHVTLYTESCLSTLHTPPQHSTEYAAVCCAMQPRPCVAREPDAIPKRSVPASRPARRERGQTSLKNICFTPGCACLHGCLVCVVTVLRGVLVCSITWVNLGLSAGAAECAARAGGCFVVVDVCYTCDFAWKAAFRACGRAVGVRGVRPCDNINLNNHK